MNSEKNIWYGNVQKIIRGIAIFCCIVALLVIKQEGNFLEFVSRILPMDNYLHDYIFKDLAMKLTPYACIATNIILVTAIIILILAYGYSKDTIKASYVFHTTGMLLCGISGILYILVHYFIGYCSLQINFKTVLVLLLILLALAAVAIDIIFYVKAKIKYEGSYILTAILITILGIGCLVGCGVYLGKKIGPDFKATQDDYKLIKNHREGYSEEIGYQIGNISNGAAIYYDDHIYYKFSDSIYKISPSGSTEKIYSLEEDKYLAGGIYIYDGYIYTRIEDGLMSTYSSMVRISMDTGLVENINTKEKVSYSGIVDGKLYYAIKSKATNETLVYYLDLDKSVKEADAVLYDKYSGTSRLYGEEWLAKYLYNYTQVPYFGSPQEDIQFIQDAYCYSIDTYDYDEYYNDPDSFTYTANCELNISTPKKPLASIENVVDYNIFDNTIYYAQETKSGYEIFSCDKEENNKTLIATIPMNFVEDDFAYSFNLYMGEDYMFCRISHQLEVNGKASGKERWDYTISIQDGTINKVTFE